MVLKRNLKKWLVFTLAFIFDQYEEISIKNFYRSFYFPGAEQRKKSITQMFSRMIKVKEIEKTEEKGEVYLKLTDKGGRFFNEKISLKNFSERNWDGLWRLVVFDIDEVERNTRNRLRRKLKEWGFVLWQESVYLSPHPIISEIDEFLKVNQLFPKVVALESKIIGVKNYDRFAWVVFKLGELEEEYLNLEEKINQFFSSKEKEKEKRKREEIIEQFKRLILKDPFLPRGLLNKDWPRERIKNKIKKLLIMK